MYKFIEANYRSSPIISTISDYNFGSCALKILGRVVFTTDDVQGNYDDLQSGYKNVSYEFHNVCMIYNLIES